MFKISKAPVVPPSNAQPQPGDARRVAVNKTGIRAGLVMGKGPIPT